MIVQQELAEAHRYHTHRIRGDQLNAEERAIFNALKAGAGVEQGVHGARIETRRVRPRISWRKEFEKLAGPEKTRELIERVRSEAREAEYLVLE